MFQCQCDFAEAVIHCTANVLAQSLDGGGKCAGVACCLVVGGLCCCLLRFPVEFAEPKLMLGNPLRAAA
jgi:hypothetical protein